MKKNIRFVSAAAAALLAVAPVVASTTTAANAAVVTKPGNNAVVVPDDGKKTVPSLNFSSTLGNQDLEKQGFGNFVDLKSFNLSNFLSDSNIEKNVNVASTVSGDKPSIVGVNNAKITYTNKSGDNVAIDGQSDLVAGQTYYLQVSVSVNGLSKTKKYTSDSAAFDKTLNWTEDGQKYEGAESTNQGTITNIKIAVPLHFYNSDLADQPSFGSTYLKNNALANNQTIEAPKTVKVDGKDTKVNAANSATVLAALKKLGLSSNRSSYATGDQNDANNVINYSSKLTSSNFSNFENTIDAPSDGRTVVNSFSSNWTTTTTDANGKTTTTYKPGSVYTLKRINIFSGKTATLNVAFNASTEDPSYPLIQYRNNKDSKWYSVKQKDNTFDNAMPVAKVTLGDANWAEDLLNNFRALQSSQNNNKLRLTTDNLHVDNMNVNQSGLYNATLTATNSNGKKTTLNFEVAVSGDKKDEMANYFVTTENGEVVNLVSLVKDSSGNYTTSNQNGVVVNNGQPITVYPNDTQKVGDVEYTRVAAVGKTREASNLWIPTKNLKAAVEKKLEKTGTVKVMHNAYVYTFDKDGNKSRVGTRKIATYSMQDVYGTKTVNGSKYYRISADKEEYIAAGNVDGTKRTLKHNAYIYATSKKRANKKVLKKGESVTTYGSAVKFKNGKYYYRIEGCTASNKMYVKKANF